MNDLTTGSLTGHLLKTTSFMLVSMVFQTLYVLIDLYWVGRLGTDAVAAVAVSSNLMFFVLAATQMLGVGTTTLVAHATGQKDQARASLVFNQANGLSVVVGLLFLVVVLAIRVPYANALSADAATAQMAADYLLWFVPAMALQFGLIGMGAALRGTGNFKPGMVVQTATVILNIVLAPVFIFGWLGAPAMGVVGAAIATLIAIVVGVVWMTTYFLSHTSFLKFVPSEWTPRPRLWADMLKIGLPAGAEFALIAAYLMLVFVVSRPFGAAAQAGFGIGQRILQASFLPVVALGFAVGPVAGQNFGARKADRVRATFSAAVKLATGVMVVLSTITWLAAAWFIQIFSNDPAVIAAGEEYLHVAAINFVASGAIFVSSSMFQALGNTWPALITSGTRMVIIAIPVLWLSTQPGFTMKWVWYISAAGVFIQLGLNLWLMQREFRLRLRFDTVPAPVGAPPVAVPAGVAK
jgi:putative MATE family efflux protein